MHHRMLTIAFGQARFVALMLVTACFLVRSDVKAAEPEKPSPRHLLDEAEKECQSQLDADQCQVQTLSNCQRAAHLSELSLGTFHTRTATNFYNLGVCYNLLGYSDKSEAFARRCVEIRKKLLGNNNKDIAECLNSVAIALDAQGKYKEAESYYRQAMEIFQKILGEEHLDTAVMMNNLGSVMSIQGKYIDAELLHRRALLISEKIEASKKTVTSQSLGLLSSVLFSQGKILEAEKYSRRELSIRQTSSSSKHPDLASCLQTLAAILSGQGMLNEAEQFYREALDMRKDLFGAEHPIIPRSKTELATVLKLQGRLTEAERLLNESIEIYQRHPNWAQVGLGRSLLILSMVLQDVGRLHAAESRARHSLNLNQKLYGDDNPIIADSLHQLSSVLTDLGRLDEAELLVRKSIDIWTKGFGQETPRVATGIQNVGLLLAQKGQFEKASELLSRSLLMRQRILGNEHPEVAISKINIARNLIMQDRISSAIPLLKSALEINEKTIRTIYTEALMQARLQNLQIDEATIYGLLANNHTEKEIEFLATELALLRKGRTLDAGAKVNRLLRRSLNQPIVRQRFDEWLIVKQQQESLLFGELGKRSADDYQRQLIGLQIQAESLEQALAVEIPELRSIQLPTHGKIAQSISWKLPPEGVLIELVFAKPLYDYSKKENVPNPHYVGLLLFPEQKIVSVDVGEVSKIDDAISTLEHALSRPSSDPKPAAEALYELFFAKLVPHLKGRKDVYLSLDGSLHLIPFDALHDGTDYLLGRYKFHYLTSGRDLLRKPSSQPVGPALVIGNPYFGSGAKASDETGSSVYQRLTNLSDLPWAQQEAETVAKLLGVRAVTGASAKEELLRARLAPSVVHLATHGLFLTDVEPPMLPGTRSALLMASPPEQKKPAGTEPPVSLPGLFGPMNRAALVFANARQGATVEDKSKDGLLTAEEARRLDLDGTQLVVLSACETGQGETSSGQGVYGLRRAFLIAGAETVVTSLWRVHDEATGELMTKYYGKLLDKEHPGDRLGAMIESMQELRARPGREHPYYWAPFLVIGADGPLRHTAMR